ncbi:MAG: DNA cytosine methyltransferase [Prevotella sp.]|nr:DNA cytosine methyltransferase [Prevotella sp.]
MERKGLSPTVVTLPNDFIHYHRHRALTVREMAHLQFFNDSFVFQGKRTRAAISVSRRHHSIRW